jgi:hypothetical protein
MGHLRLTLFKTALDVCRPARVRNTNCRSRVLGWTRRIAPALCGT